MKKLGLIVIGLLSANTLFAQTSQLSYDYVGAGYGVGEILDEDFSVFGLNASYSLNDNWFLKGAWSDGSSDDSINYGFGLSDEIDFNSYNFGIGIHTALNQTTDFVVGVAYAESEMEFANSSNDVDGFGVDAGFRFKPASNLEFNAFLDYYGLDDDGELGYSVSGFYFVSPTLSLGLGYAGADDVDSISANVRFHF